MPSEPTSIFVSYARADSEQTLKLARDLKTARINVWLDQLDIPAGARWDQAVEEALERSSCLIVVLSPRSVISHNVMDEVFYAIDEKKDVLPVLIERCKVPLRLRRLQFIDFTEGYDKSFEKLLRLLRPVPGREEQEDESANKPTAEGLLRLSGQSGSGESTTQKGWRSELLSKGWVERSIRVFLTHESHVVDLHVHLSKLETVVRIDGVTSATAPLKEGHTKCNFRLTDGSAKYSASIDVTRSFLTERIKQFRLRVGHQTLYSE